MGCCPNIAAVVKQLRTKKWREGSRGSATDRDQGVRGGDQRLIWKRVQKDGKSVTVTKNRHHRENSGEKSIRIKDTHGTRSNAGEMASHAPKMG